MGQLVIDTNGFKEGDKVKYVTTNGICVGIICGFKYMQHPYKTKMMYGIMLENNYNDRENNKYKIDWITPDNITPFNEKLTNTENNYEE